MREQNQTSPSRSPWRVTFIKLLTTLVFLWLVKDTIDILRVTHLLPPSKPSGTKQIIGVCVVAALPIIYLLCLAIASYFEVKEASLKTKIIHILAALLLPFFVIAGFISTSALIVFVGIGKLNTPTGLWVLLAFCVSVGGYVLTDIIRNNIREKMLQKNIDFLRRTNPTVAHSLKAILDKKETLDDLLAIAPYPDIRARIDDFYERAERLINKEPKLKKAFDEALDSDLMRMEFIELLAEYKSGTLTEKNAIYALSFGLLTDKQQVIEILQKRKPACPKTLERLKSPTYDKDNAKTVDDLITLLEMESR